MPNIHPVKDEEHEHLIPEVWRTTLAAIVDSIAVEGQLIGAGLPDVEPFSDVESQSCRDYIRNDGRATLGALPDAAWETSVCLWHGTHWECLVDLWTAEEGRSDLVLEVKVREQEPERYVYSPYLVYVP